jgi:hypothetical protein
MRFGEVHNMMRVRRATCGAAALAALAGLLSGCMSSDSCGRPGLMSRLGCRSRTTGSVCSGSMGMTASPVSSGAFVGEPVGSDFPIGGSGPGCCDGPSLGPSGFPGEGMYSGMHQGFNGSSLIPPGAVMGEPMTLPPGAKLPPGAVPMPGGSFAPSNVLPAPTPEPGPMQLTPVPKGYAEPTPATPSSRKRS